MVASAIEQSSEAELIARFFDGIEKYTPDLVSWNGSGFDLPVLHYRALKAGVQAPRYWETGDEDTSFRYNNYLSRFHWRHLDLMDVLVRLPGSRRAPRSATWPRCWDCPGKLGFSGARSGTRCWPDSSAAVRNYCETDVLNTYLVLLRFELFRGRLDQDAYRAGTRAPARTGCAPPREAHHQQFLEAWEPDGLRPARPALVETGRVDSLNHEGEGVVRGGKTAFVSGALPGEIGELRPSPPAPAAR